LLLLSLSSCGSFLTEGTADLAGIAGAGAAAAITKSGAAAAAIGLGVRSIASEGVKYVTRRVHRTEQDAIAAAAGPLEPGTVGVWFVRHSLPIEDDANGQLVVSREFGAGSFQCKEVVFSVDRITRRAPPDKPERAFYITTICRDGEAWLWALAEPSTERWGGLQ